MATIVAPSPHPRVQEWIDGGLSLPENSGVITNDPAFAAEPPAENQAPQQTAQNAAPPEAPPQEDQRDRVIAQMRQQLIQSTGVDPFTGQPIARPQPLPDPRQAQSPEEYWNQIDNFVNQKIAEKVTQMAPGIQQSNMRGAREMIEGEYRDFGTVANSKYMKQVLAGDPTLNDDIVRAENGMDDPRRLPTLYKAAYAQAKLLEVQEAQTPNVMQKQQPERPLATPQRQYHIPDAASAAGQYVPTKQNEIALMSRNQRRNYIQQMRQRGIEDFTYRPTMAQ